MMFGPHHHCWIASAQISLRDWIGRVPESLRRPLMLGGLALLGVLVLGAAWRSISRAARRRRAPTIHPKLQKYNVDHAELAREHEAKAAAIVATSTGNRLAGYRIVRQVDAVIVEGYRTPEEALTALKALAADRGANAILNVRTERSAVGRCSASGDAVQAGAMLAPPRRSQPPPLPGKKSD